MAWTAPITFVSGAVLTAAQLNAMQANILESAAAKATTAGRYFAATGANALAERAFSSGLDDSILATGSTSYTGTTPNVSVVHGVNALIVITGEFQVNTNSAYALMSFDISGAATLAAADIRAIGTGRFTISTAIMASGIFLAGGITPGTSTYGCRYKTDTGGATATFNHRRIIVIPF